MTHTPYEEPGILDPIEQHVIDKVRKLRVDGNLRQKDIAIVLNTTASFIGNVENSHCIAKYNLKHISLLAKYFGISPRDFLPDKARSKK